MITLEIEDSMVKFRDGHRGIFYQLTLYRAYRLIQLLKAGRQRQYVSDQYHIDHEQIQRLLDREGSVKRYLGKLTRTYDYRNDSAYHEMLRKLKRTVYAVEADDFAKNQLWLSYSKGGSKFLTHSNEDNRYRAPWEQDTSGSLPTIGTIEGPNGEGYNVSISLSWYMIDGHWVLFYWLTSRYCDHDMAREWLFKHMPHLFPNGIERVGHLTDANGFHRCMHHLRTLNEANTEG